MLSVPVYRWDLPEDHAAAWKQNVRRLADGRTGCGAVHVGDSSHQSACRWRDSSGWSSRCGEALAADGGGLDRADHQ